VEGRNELIRKLLIFGVIECVVDGERGVTFERLEDGEFEYEDVRECVRVEMELLFGLI
jgi:hypothetical protein